MFFLLDIIGVYIFIQIEKIILHRLHILDFLMMYRGNKNIRKKDGNVVRTSY